MTDIDKLLAEFIDALHSGETPEPADYLERVEDDAQRAALAENIVTAIDFLPDAVRHPREADGSFKLGASQEQISAAASMKWPELLPAWRHGQEMTIEQVAERTLQSGGLEVSGKNIAAARSWIAAMEAGIESARTISWQALQAVGFALKIPEKQMMLSGSFEPQPAAAAFRADDNDAAHLAASKLMIVADAVDDALPKEDTDNEVDAFFKEDA